MTVETKKALRISRTIKADREAVWDAWTRPEQVKKWSCPEPGGVVDFTCDLRVGGEFTLHMRVQGDEHTAFGTYREIDRPNRIAYTWDWKEEDHHVGGSLVTVEFHEVPAGTEVVLVHEELPDQESRDAHEQGWNACLDHFERLFAAA